MVNLQAAIRELESERDRINKALDALHGIRQSGSSGRGRGGPRRMSAAARRRIAAGQKARWAKWKKAHRAK